MGKCDREEIKSFHRESNNCFQDVIGMILINNDFDPLLMYSGSLNFGYNKRGKLFGERILPSRDGEWLDCSLEKSLIEYYGLSFEKKKKIAAQDVIGDINESSNGIILEVDVFECEWHVFYQKIHSLHYCWVLEVKDQYYICALPYGEKYGKIRVDFGRKYNYLKYKIVKKNTSIDIYDILHRTYISCMTGINGISDIEQLKMLRNDVYTEGIDLVVEKSDFYDIINVPIVRALEWILWSRINYYSVLEKFCVVESSVCLLEELQKLIDIWRGIKNYIIIQMMRGEKFIQFDLVGHLDEAIAEESIFLEKINDFLRLQRNLFP